MIESEIKEFTNLIAKWRTQPTHSQVASAMLLGCAIELENVLDALAPPVDPVVGDYHEDENGNLEHGTDESMLERFDDKTCPECGRKYEPES